MGRVLAFLGVGTFIKIAATVAVALLAFGAMATQAWAQDTTLSVEKTADPDPGKVGEVLTYTVVVTNTGANEADNVTLSDVLEYGTVEVAAPPAVTTTAGSCFPLSRTFVSCTLGNLAAGESTTVTIELEPTTPGTISNTVIAAATNAPAVEDAVTTAVVPDLVIDKSANRDTTVWLASLSYTLRVTNQGPTTADNVIVTDGVPLGGVSVTSDDFTCEEDRSFVRCEGSLLAGETGTVEISGQVPQEVSAIENTAQVSVEGVSIVISEDTVETTVRIPGPGDEPGGEEPENDKGEWVLVNHKGKKELCLPKAALNGHLNHGDEVISEEGCSDDTEGGGRRGLR